MAEFRFRIAGQFISQKNFGNKGELVKKKITLTAALKECKRQEKVHRVLFRQEPNLSERIKQAKSLISYLSQKGDFFGLAELEAVILAEIKNKNPVRLSIKTIKGGKYKYLAYWDLSGKRQLRYIGKL